MVLRSQPDFVAALGNLFEHSSWVVERAWAKGPFDDAASLHRALMAVVDEATSAEQLALINAHPELAACAVPLTEASDAEQAGAGLKNLSTDEFEKFATLNAAYRGKFGFPFIICVRQHSKTSIFAAFAQRLGHDAAAERAQALMEIGQISWLRLSDMKLDMAGART